MVRHGPATRTLTKRAHGAAVMAIVLVALATGPAHARPGPDRITQLRADIAAVLDEHRAPGVGIALVDRSGVLWAGGVGLADVSEGRPMAPDTLFRVASITKSFVALGAVRLHERGALDLDAPLATLLPDVAMDNPWADQRPVTLAHVLEHTAGFDDMRFNEFAAGPGEIAPVLEVLARNPRSRTSRWQPGTRFSYANPGYTVAAAAIERASGIGYRALLDDAVFAPLDMTDVHWQVSTPDTAGRIATGYDRVGAPAPRFEIAHHPAGALVTTPLELGRFVHHWLRRSDAIASAAMRTRIERSATLPYGPRDSDYGLGNYGALVHGARCRGHDGGLPGFVSTYRYCPDLGIGYVVLSNQTYSGRAHFEIERLVLHALADGIDAPTAPRAPESAAERGRVAGYYQFDNPRHELMAFVVRTMHGVDIVDLGDRLVARPTSGGELPLVRTGDMTYRLPFEGGTTIRFATGADGRDILLADWGHFVRAPRRAARVRRAAALAGWRVMTSTLWAMLLVLGLWLTSAVAGRGERPATARALLLPALSAGALMAAPLVAVLAGMPALATPTWASIAVFALTIGHAALAAAAVVDAALALRRQVVQRSGGAALAARLAGLIAALACAGYAAWLGCNGIVGLRTWAW